MANPQTEDGHVDIANELIEAFARIRIPGEAMQLLWVIIRQTYGWHKKEDRISVSQFCDRTGMLKPHIVNNLKKLVAMGVVTEKGNDRQKSYKINKNYDNWKPLPKKVTLPKKVMVITEKGNDVTEKGNDLLPKKVPTKEKKETSQKQLTDDSSAITLSTHLLDSILKNNHKSKLHALHNGDRHSKIQAWAIDIEKLIRIDKQDFPTIRKVIEFATSDAFWRANILSGEKLRDKWDTLVANMDRKKSHEQPETETPSKISQKIHFRDAPGGKYIRVDPNGEDREVEKDQMVEELAAMRGPPNPVQQFIQELSNPE